ncbi:DUF202 domain-containing protein [Kineococcus sp. SYSU DK004]|uniref:DUF202 domain-containing protein n=1 Tax=Kineococcus sp. SYSU DK004 TaxID=3383125 RepID=UPI003D7DCD03
MSGDPRPRVFDPGLQPERTALAWRRTALGVLVGSLVLARLLAPVLGGAALAVALTGAAAGTWLLVASGRRSAHQVRVLLRDGDLRAGPGAGVPAVAAALTALVGALGLVLLLVRAATVVS